MALKLKPICFLEIKNDSEPTQREALLFAGLSGEGLSGQSLGLVGRWKGQEEVLDSDAEFLRGLGRL